MCYTLAGHNLCRLDDKVVSNQEQAFMDRRCHIWRNTVNTTPVLSKCAIEKHKHGNVNEYDHRL